MSAISDQKKRTLEAIQQRYAATKAKKLHDEQIKCQKKGKDSTPKPKFDAPTRGKASESTPSRSSSQIQSHQALANSSSRHHQKPSTSLGEEVNPVYSEISFPCHDNISQNRTSDLDRTDVVHSVVYDIIQKGGEGGKITKGAKKLKLEKGILLDNYVQRGPRFDLYKPMHELWKEYIRELTKTTSTKKLSEYLLSADLHGALLIVAECKAASYQGVSGIMIRDTAETFGIITEDNRFRVVPKAGSIFILQADCWKVTLIGDKLSPKQTLKENQRLQRAQSLIR